MTWQGQCLCYGMALCLSWLALTQFRLSLASRISDRADAAMSYWTTPQMKRDPTQSEIDYVERLLLKARVLSPGNPTDHERLGQSYLWELATQSPSQARREQLRELGLAEVRRFVAEEPGWALAWAALLVWKAEFEEMDPEFRTALERATTLGQWHIKIHPTLLQATLPLWDQLDADSQGMVLDTAVRGLRQYPLYTRPIVMDYGRLSDVCLRLLEGDPLQHSQCPSEFRGETSH